mmetsp:Transcript_88276/g.156503  ORF Transcript_88276/g.156503 Transcript_88276/m.156503 type:complete len:342 (-) Transcript_88276:307-1332(-)|eukprot:CAMPEP_0197626828 /NCGR_PEP_ID=MMETSP1338-20131121/5621_1 /TAXON_ID=43686 ORGANISM="Pelagodinium beii, Strain RCC1491" /NCGR_SAMPLE_ID=MMETSP1338 /ASSEMBLY_ACC=CAM_ASM_000754 /LENGTH=341 /DNA_ID=CAMNT_0043197397 /DNA_START=65 /DNA_END=1090 /DNA_ORIENTATION=+
MKSQSFAAMVVLFCFAESKQAPAGTDCHAKLHESHITCTHITKEEQCQQAYVNLMRGSGAQSANCGWRGGNCVTVAYCKAPAPFTGKIVLYAVSEGGGVFKCDVNDNKCDLKKKGGKSQGIGLALNGDVLVCENTANRVLQCSPSTWACKTVVSNIQNPLFANQDADGSFTAGYTGVYKCLANDGGCTKVVDALGATYSAVRLSSGEYVVIETYTSRNKKGPAWKCPAGSNQKAESDCTAFGPDPAQTAMTWPFGITVSPRGDYILTEQTKIWKCPQNEPTKCIVEQEGLEKARRAFLAADGNYYVAETGGTIKKCTAGTCTTVGDKITGLYDIVVQVVDA